MPELYTALSVGVEEDLLPLSALLHQRGVNHRVYEEGGRQVLKVARAEEAEQVQSLYQAWRDGEVRIELTPGQPAPGGSGVRQVWHETPITLSLIALSVIGFLLVYLPPLNPLISYFTFTPFQVAQEQLLFGFMGSQYWRLVTPAFLHFGWLHIVFNSLWMWELGQKVEHVMGRLNMILLFLVIALVSNLSQYMLNGPGLFGGMSGVVYGLLGFAWVAPLLQPRWVIQPTPMIMIFMVGWLLLCLVGVVEVLGFGAIANAAHIGGLLSGGVLGLAFGLLSRQGSDKA